MPRTCLSCHRPIEDPVLRRLPICNPCAFHLQAQVIDDAIDDGVLAFDHFDGQGRAVYRSLIYRA